MIILPTTNDVLRITLGAAHTTNPLQLVASWRDITTTTYAPGNSLGASNGTTPANIVAAPGASTQRVIDFVSVYNADTIEQTVTLTQYDGTNSFVLWRGSLLPDERLEFVPGAGFKVFTASGIEKVLSMLSPASGLGNQWQFVWLESEETHSAGTTLTPVPGMTIDVVAGRHYLVRAWANIRTQATTTGARMRLGLTGVTFATTGFGAGHLRMPVTGTTEQIANGGPALGPSVPATSSLAQRYGGNLYYGEMVLISETTQAAGIRMEVAAEIASDIYVCPGSVMAWVEYTP